MPTEEELAESKARLNIPDDWEWYDCQAGCGDVVWCPPGIGDTQAIVVCGNDCLQTVLASHSGT
jgi:hypothetical protein